MNKVLFILIIISIFFLILFVNNNASDSPGSPDSPALPPEPSPFTFACEAPMIRNGTGNLQQDKHTQVDMIHAKQFDTSADNFFYTVRMYALENLPLATQFAFNETGLVKYYSNGSFSEPPFEQPYCTAEIPVNGQYNTYIATPSQQGIVNSTVSSRSGSSGETTYSCVSVNDYPTGSAGYNFCLEHCTGINHVTQLWSNCTGITEPQIPSPSSADLYCDGNSDIALNQCLDASVIFMESASDIGGINACATMSSTPAASFASVCKTYDQWGNQVRNIYDDSPAGEMRKIWKDNEAINCAKNYLGKLNAYTSPASLNYYANLITSDPSMAALFGYNATNCNDLTLYSEPAADKIANLSPFQVINGDNSWYLMLGEQGEYAYPAGTPQENQCTTMYNLMTEQIDNNEKGGLFSNMMDSNFQKYFCANHNYDALSCSKLFKKINVPATTILRSDDPSSPFLSTNTQSFILSPQAISLCNSYCQDWDSPNVQSIVNTFTENNIANIQNLPLKAINYNGNITEDKEKILKMQDGEIRIANSFKPEGSSCLTNKADNTWPASFPRKFNDTFYTIQFTNNQPPSAAILSGSGEFQSPCGAFYEVQDVNTYYNLMPDKKIMKYAPSSTIPCDTYTEFDPTKDVFPTDIDVVKDVLTCECPINYITTLDSDTNQVICTACPDGTYSNKNNWDVNGCQSCPAGYIGVGNNCQPCPSGTYKSDSDSCTACPLGQYTNTVGNFSCNMCPDGQFAVNSSYTAVQAGATACAACPNGPSGAKQYYYSAPDDPNGECIVPFKLIATTGDDPVGNIPGNGFQQVYMPFNDSKSKAEYKAEAWEYTFSEPDKFGMYKDYFPIVSYTDCINTECADADKLGIASYGNYNNNYYGYLYVVNDPETLSPYRNILLGHKKVLKEAKGTMGAPGYNEDGGYENIWDDSGSSGTYDWGYVNSKFVWNASGNPTGVQLPNSAWNEAKATYYGNLSGTMNPGHHPFSAFPIYGADIKFLEQVPSENMIFSYDDKKSHAKGGVNGFNTYFMYTNKDYGTSWGSYCGKNLSIVGQPCNKFAPSNSDYTEYGTNYPVTNVWMQPKCEYVDTTYAANPATCVYKENQ